MKKWIIPTIEELNFIETAVIGAENAISGVPQEDNWMCSNQYWQGNPDYKPHEGWKGEWGEWGQG
ncbi:MAG: hypothetical protein E7290_09785 [Lachnospiraceae bacterium]|nr:hypothetical protein [Lachnospiraceae bacterium]